MLIGGRYTSASGARLASAAGSAQQAPTAVECTFRYRRLYAADHYCGGAAAHAARRKNAASLVIKSSATILLLMAERLSELQREGAFSVSYHG